MYFTGGTPGDDAWITEKKRALALLDLPQPQVLVNAWSIQSSTSKADDSGQLLSLLHGVVNSFNETIQKSIGIGWSALQKGTATPGDYFDPLFSNYIMLRTVADPARQNQGDWPPDNSGACPFNQYCLGYAAIFRPPQPRLTDMLLTLLAAKKPADAVNKVIGAMECGDRQMDWKSLPDSCGSENRPSAGQENELDKREDLKDLLKYLLLAPAPAIPLGGCQKSDTNLLLNRMEHDPGDMRLPLECFRQTMGMSEGQVGLTRAAVADFLFNYKFSQQYPHEFAPYDLTSSAQALDAALAPYVHAFNQDLLAFQSFVRAELIVDAHVMKLDRDKNTFLNDGLITVQTTSGDVASVDTGTQSFMNVSRAPSISELLSSVIEAAPGGTAAAGTTPALSGVISNLSFNQAQVLEGALAAYQSTSLNVGRQLNLVVKPRSLVGAQAAEIDVQFDADQMSSTPNYWTPGPGGGAGASADLSAVTQHDVTTHVRVDSIRLFDVSSLTAVLSKGRDKLPLLPPLIEIPYIGTLLGIPLPAAREFHTSDAVISAVIVPTATDIAYSLRFSKDRIVSNDCQEPMLLGKQGCRSQQAISIRDFQDEPIREFHRLILHCLIAEEPASDSATSNAPPECAEPAFSGALYDASSDSDQ